MHRFFLMFGIFACDTDKEEVELTLFTSCGDPACEGYTGPNDGVPICTQESLEEGDVCTEEGIVCDLEDECNRTLICAEDYSTDNCPQSKAIFKRNIVYIDEAKSHSISADVLNMKIAEWEYKKDPPNRKVHLGFIIDDNPGSPAVHVSGEQVDLYGYTSMAIVTIQQQQIQMERLEKRIAELEKKLDKQ